MATRPFRHLQREIAACERCPRLRDHCRAVARQRRPMFHDEDYWGRPVPSFGTPPARLLIVGLAPAAHGANRTGRMFTGDSSGDWLYDALHRFGLANQARSVSSGDGLQLHDTVITAAAHCAPPGNRPTAEELANCRPFLRRELRIVRPRLVLCLGRIAYESWWKVLGEEGVEQPRPRPGFGHNRLVEIPGGPRRPRAEGVARILLSYHPSRQNTNTGRLTREMWYAVFRRVREELDRLDAPGRPRDPRTTAQR